MNLIPKKYKNLHRYFVIVYDTLASILKQVESANLLTVQFKFKDPKEKPEFEHLERDDAYEWLKDHNYDDVIYKLSFNQCFAGLLTDLLQFISNALKASEKGQLNVSFALLRKPLKENLFYLEYLVAHEEKFIKLFNSEKGSENLAVDKVQKQEKIQIIKETCQKIGFRAWPAEDLYDMRYNKRNPLSFEPSFQTATHLITTADGYKTEEGNFNFIFSTYKDKMSQWDFLYSSLPILMLYTYDICSHLFGKIGRKNPVWQLMNMRFYLGYLYATKGYKAIKEDFQGIFKGFEATCGKCSSHFIFDHNQFKHFFYRFEVKCQTCGSSFSLIR